MTTTTETLEPGTLADRAAEALAFVNDGTGEVGDLFAPSFLSAIPEARLRQITETNVRPGGPYEIVKVLSQTSTSAELLVRGAATQKMSITIEPQAPYRIVGLLFQPAQVDLESWDDLDERLADAAPEVAFLAAEIVDGECQTVHEVEADRILPLGSAFKLYVLGALARAIDEGTASWDDEIEIRDDARVHSSATYGETPAGTKVRIEDLATAMISVSDNTATDLVMAHVGRQAIEASLGGLGMDDPGRNLPFVTTRELSLLKWGVEADVREAYIVADPDRRRDLLDQLPAHAATQTDLLSGNVTVPTAIDELEWFASPADLCRVHVALQELASKPGLEPLRRILSVNPGVPMADAWTYVAFKGGSEPGVLAGSWLAERDGRRFFVAAQLENTRGAVELPAIGDAAGAFGLLADL